MAWRDMDSEQRRERWRSACSMCMGTDCEAACRQGQCYAERMRAQEAAERRSEQWEREHDQFHGVGQ